MASNTSRGSTTRSGAEFRTFVNKVPSHTHSGAIGHNPGPQHLLIYFLYIISNNFVSQCIGWINKFRDLHVVRAKNA